MRPLRFSQAVGDGGAFDAPPTGATLGLRPRLADSPSRRE